jgi:hypothetical protein
MSDRVILHFDAEEHSETDAEFHTITITVDEPMVRMLERYQAFSQTEGVTISKVTQALVDDEEETISLECLLDGGFSLEAMQRVKNMWPVDVISSGIITCEQVITAYYVAHRMELSEGFIPRAGANIYLFKTEDMTEEFREQIDEVFHEERDGEDFLNSQAGIVIRKKEEPDGRH